MVSFSDAVKTCLFKKFATFKGRATRAEFWWFELFQWLVIFAVSVVVELFFSPFNDGFLTFCIVTCFISIVLIIPRLAVLVRRLHDVYVSGIIIILCFIPFVNWAAIPATFIHTLEPSGDDNKYGPKPENV